MGTFGYIFWAFVITVFAGGVFVGIYDLIDGILKPERIKKKDAYERLERINYAFRKLSDEEKFEIESIKSEYMVYIRIQNECNRLYSIALNKFLRTENRPFEFSFERGILYKSEYMPSGMIGMKNACPEPGPSDFLNEEQIAFYMRDSYTAFFRDLNGIQLAPDKESMLKIASYYLRYHKAENKKNELRNKMQILIPNCGPLIVPPILSDMPGNFYY